MGNPLIQNGGIVWGLGMCASGSTWLFNIILKLAESLAPGLPLAHAPRGLLKAIDRGALSAWSTAEARHRTAAMAQSRIDAGKEWPLLQPGKGGRPVISPYVTIQERAAVIMLRAADALGFTPPSRPRIELVPGPAPSPILEGEAELDPWEALARLHGRDVA